MAKAQILKDVDLRDLSTEQMEAINKILAEQKNKKKAKIRTHKMEARCPGYRTLLKEYIKLATPKEFIATVPVTVIFKMAWESSLDYDVVEADFYGGWWNALQSKRRQPRDIKKIAAEHEKQIVAFCDKLEKVIVKANKENNNPSPMDTKFEIDQEVNDILYEMSEDMRKKRY